MEQHNVEPVDVRRLVSLNSAFLLKFKAVEQGAWEIGDWSFPFQLVVITFGVGW